MQPVEQQTAEAEENRTEFVQSLERGLAVLRAFAEQRSTLTLTDVANATGLKRAAARRFLLTLVELGYVRSRGREFSLRPRVLDFGNAYLSGLAVPELAEPHMNVLADTVQESCSLAVLDDDEIAYVAHVSPQRVMTVSVEIGARDPAYCTSLGRVLLAALGEDALAAYLERTRLRRHTSDTLTDRRKLVAALQETRTKGYAIIAGELQNGLVAVGMPVHAPSGEVIAAMNVTGYEIRASEGVLVGEYLPHLRAAVAEVERALARATALAPPGTAIVLPADAGRALARRTSAAAPSDAPRRRQRAQRPTRGAGAR